MSLHFWTLFPAFSASALHCTPAQRGAPARSAPMGRFSIAERLRSSIFRVDSSDDDEPDPAERRRRKKERPACLSAGLRFSMSQ